MSDSKTLSPFTSLTNRELEALEQIVLSGSVKIAARSLNISYRTMEIHVNHIKEKLNLGYKHQFNRIVIENIVIENMYKKNF